MTAFYTFRMMYMTFRGEWRGPRAVWHHIHESAATMVVPLVILAVPTILVGLLLGIPPEGGAIHGWLEDVFAHAEEIGAGILPGSILATGEHHGFELFGLGGLLLLVGAIGGRAGHLARLPLVRAASPRRRRASSAASRWASGRGCTAPA